MSSMEKLVAPRKADTSGSSDKASDSLVGTTPLEGKRVPALTIAYSPKESHDVRADIVFVGGVCGPDPLRNSWVDSQKNVHWPSQLLPTDVPFARVLMYHYALDTEILSARPADYNLEWHAFQLLAGLARIRIDSQTEDQKIIFVAHGTGGLIVQRTLAIARYGCISQVVKCVSGIIFFGTPLRKIHRAGWKRLGLIIARMGDLNEETLIDQMMSASAYLDDLCSEFYQTEINIASFYEELRTPGIGFVVERPDATPPEYMSNAICNGIYATHANLARFSKKDELGYLMVTASIRRWIEHEAFANKLQRWAAIHASKTFAALRTVLKKVVPLTSLFGPTFPARERPPMPEEATNVAHPTNNSLQVSNTSQNIENRPLFVGSTLSQLLKNPPNFINSLLSRFYMNILGQVLGFLQGLNLYEPPLSANCVRLKWICVCGNSFFRDFVLSEESSAYSLRDVLLVSGYQAALFVNPSNSQAAAHGSNVMRQSTTTSVNNQGTGPGPSSNHTAGRRDEVPGDRDPSRIAANTNPGVPSNDPSVDLGGMMVTPDDAAKNPRTDRGPKSMWMLACFYYNQYVPQAVHLNIQESDDDVCLIKVVRQKHFEKRGRFAFYISWKAVTKITFVKFGYILDPRTEAGLALLREDWGPPTGWKDTNFWEPCPAEPRPTAEQGFLLHLWNHPHDSRSYLVIQTTKLQLLQLAKRLLRWPWKTRDQYKREQLPFSNRNNLERIHHHDDSSQKAIGKGRYLFKSLPKRLEKELKAHLDEPPLGWGLYFEESMVVPAPLRYLGIFIAIVMILSAVVSTLILVYKRGVAYFGMGNFGIGIAAIVTTLVLKLIAV